MTLSIWDHILRILKRISMFAWDACNKLDKVWKSDLHINLKVQTFQTLIEPIFLYGSEKWTLSTRLERRIDGTYTNMLRKH